MAENWKVIGGIATLILILTIGVYTLQVTGKSDICTKNGTKEAWIPTALPYRYYCSIENKTEWCYNLTTYGIPNSKCLLLKLINYSSPTLEGSLTKFDFAYMTENHPDLVTSWTEYHLCKPKKILDSDLENFRFSFKTEKGVLESFHLEISEEKSQIINDYKTLCYPYNETIEYINGTQILEYSNCTQILIGNHTEYNFEWKERTETELTDTFKNLSIGKCVDIRVIGKREPLPGIGYLGEFAVENVLTFAGFDYPEYNWWNYSWNRRKNITITETSNAVLQGFPLLLGVDYDSDMQSDFDDLRFTYYNTTANTETEIGYVIENKTNDVQANVTINLTYIGASSQAYVYMYYNNNEILTTSNVDKVYFYDNFSGASLNPNKWQANVYGTINQTVQNGVLNTTDVTIDSWAEIYSTGNGAQDRVLGLGSVENITIEWRQYEQDDAVDVLGILGFGAINSSGAGKGILAFGGSVDTLGASVSNKHFIWINQTQIFVAGRATSTWSSNKIVLNTSGAVTSFEYFYNGASQGYGTFVGDRTTNISLVVEKYTGYLYYEQGLIDNVKIKKWASSNPTSSFGAEEQVPGFGILRQYATMVNISSTFIGWNITIIIFNNNTVSRNWTINPDSNFCSSYTTGDILSLGFYEKICGKQYTRGASDSNFTVLAPNSTTYGTIYGNNLTLINPGIVGGVAGPCNIIIEEECEV